MKFRNTDITIKEVNMPDIDSEIVNTEAIKNNTEYPYVLISGSGFYLVYHKCINKYNFNYISNTFILAGALFLPLLPLALVGIGIKIYCWPMRRWIVDTKLYDENNKMFSLKLKSGPQKRYNNRIYKKEMNKIEEDLQNAGYKT